MRYVAAAALCFVLAGCSNPKSAVIPTDPSKWDELQKQTKHLTDEDRKELASYMLRMSVGNMFSGSKAGIPPGTTIGEAISDQKKFEADQSAEDAKQAALKARIEAQRAKVAQQIQAAATLTLASMSLEPEDFTSGRAWPQIHFVIAVQNNTGKAISALRGVISFKDQFGEVLDDMDLSMDNTIAPHATATITSYYVDVRSSEQQKLSQQDLSKVVAQWKPDGIVFTDGTRIIAPDQPSNF